MCAHTAWRGLRRRGPRRSGAPGRRATRTPQSSLSLSLSLFLSLTITNLFGVKNMLVIIVTTMLRSVFIIPNRRISN